MSIPGQKSWKIQDVVAHEANVNCLALGHKSGYVLVTGGDDKKVNLWAVGKNNCIMSLSGKSPVQCVRFDPTENHVSAGSVDGVLKVWDLEAAKLIRTLSGHEGPIRALEFHPYGDFLTSGSQDTFVKLWDIRKKGCIFTYKGHTMSVNCVRFSPDGQWVSSAGQDGVIKIWDLRAGKMLHEFCEHKASVNSLVFHPHEFLLASASIENTVNFYDLEHFTLVSTTSKDSPPPRCLHFSNSGECLYAGSTDALRTYLWEPARTLVNMHIPWGRVHDMATTTNAKLVGASFFQATVSLWMVDLSQLKYNICAETEVSPEKSPFSHGNPLRKSFSKQKPTPEAKKSLSVKTIEESERSETETEEDPLPHIPDVNDYRAVFKPSRTLNRSPPPPSLFIVEDVVVPRSLEPLSHSSGGSRSGSVSPQQSLGHPPPREPPPPVLPPRGAADVPPQIIARGELHQSRPPTVRRLSVSVRDESEPEHDYPVKLSSIHHSQSETSIPRASNHGHMTAAARQKTTSQSNVNKMPVRETKSDRGVNSCIHRNRTTEVSSGRTSRQVTVRIDNRRNSVPVATSNPESPTQDPPGIVPMMAERPFDLDLSEFLPNSFERNSGQFITDEEEVIAAIMNNHQSVVAILEQRNRNLQILQSIWKEKDLKSALDTAVTMHDNAVMADLLAIVIQKPNLWNLDICVVTLPAILDLFNSKYELYLKVGCDALRLILRNFTPVIRSNVLSGSAALGVDISREERYNKCIKCYNTLLAIRAFLLKLQTHQGPLGQSFRELHNSLQAIDGS